MHSKASAPGKVILFGEHAVVFGEPAIAAALNLRTAVLAEDSASKMLNGIPLHRESNPYPYFALELTGSGPMNLTVNSDIPPGAGLGSSAALTVATVGSLRPEYGPERVATMAFEVELMAQGRASPIDTSTATHGGAVFVDRKAGTGLLWTIRRGDVTWHIHHTEVPPLNLVIGFTGRGAATGPLVENVRRLHSRFETAREAVAEIGAVTVEARKRMREGDVVGIGELMDRNQRLLSMLGVSSDEIASLIDAVRPYSYGAKLTGAGGGGSVISLTDRPEKVAEAIRKKGFIPYICSIGGEGLRLDNGPG